MLRAIRNRAQGWIAWIIVILISIPFALFGIQEYLGVNADPVVAVVDGEDIQQSALERRVRGFRENMRRMLGDKYRAELFDDKGLQAQTLQAMVSEKVLEQAVKGWNMQPNDAQIREVIQSIPAFQREGVFDAALYRSALRNQGMTGAFFEQQVRQDITLRQFEKGLQDSYFITDQRLADFIRLNEQKRAIRYARMPVVAADPSAVTEEQALAEYERLTTDFLSPERVKLAYLHLSADTLSERVAIDDDVLRTYFDEHQNDFILPEERKLRHILINDSVGDESAQLIKAQELLIELQDGVDFAGLAKTYSQDTGSATTGGDLGWMGRDVFVKPFADSAFTLSKGVISEPIKTTFGYHLIQVDDIRGGGTPDFDAQREKVVSAYRQQQLETLYYNDIERLTDIAYENPDSLSAVAEYLDMPVQETDWLERSSIFPEPLDTDKIKNAAFSEDVLQGNNSDLLERGPIDTVVLRVIAHEPVIRQPFSAVKGRVIARIAVDRALEQTQQQGKQALQALRDGADFTVLAEDWEPTTIQQVDRQAAETLPAEVVRAAFAIPRSDKRSYTGTLAKEDSYYLIEVSEVIDGDIQTLDTDTLKARRLEVQGGQHDIEYRQLREGLKERVDIDIQKR